MPFEVVLTYDPYEPLATDDPFFVEDQSDDPTQYWISPSKVDDVRNAVEVIESHAIVGSTQSIADLAVLGERLNNGIPLDTFETTAAIAALPPKLREELIDPYVSPESGEIRISGRIRDAAPFADRRAFANDVAASVQPVIESGSARVNGMMVLFDDALGRLASSQRAAIAGLIAITVVMFVALLRSVRLALAGVVPVALAAGATLSALGFLGIPLDVMTIAVASIAVGMGIDDAIHYLHRFRRERNRGLNASGAITAAHASTGRAMYFTTVVVTLGFSILVFSSFMPTIRFGILTAFAMIMALIANLVVLPALLLLIYPQESKPGEHAGS